MKTSISQSEQAASPADPQITFLATKYIPAPDGKGFAGRELDAIGLPLSQALAEQWPTDAHITAYAPHDAGKPGEPVIVRLSHGTLAEGVPACMVALIGDVDGADHKATDEWRAETLPKIEASGLAYFATRGGYRVLATLAEPITLTEPSDAVDWTRLYLGWCASLEAEYGLKLDPSCADWTRLERLPNVRREGVGAVSSPVLGELPAVDWRSIEPSKAKAQAKRRREPKGGDPAIVEPLIEALAEAIEPTWNDHSHNGFRFPFLGWLAGKGWSRDERAALIETLDDGTNTAKYLSDNDRVKPTAGPGDLVKERFDEDFPAVDRIVKKHPNARPKPKGWLARTLALLTPKAES